MYRTRNLSNTNVMSTFIHVIHVFWVDIEFFKDAFNGNEPLLNLFSGRFINTSCVKFQYGVQRTLLALDDVLESGRASVYPMVDKKRVQCRHR